MDTFSLPEIAQELGEAYYSPKTVAQFNDHDLRLALFKGDYHWHVHERDEMFLVVEGSITIETEEKTYQLKQGEGIVIPKGTRHCPKSKERAAVLLMVPTGVDPKGS